MPINFPACPTSGATPYVFPRSRYIAVGDSLTATNFGFDSHADWTGARAGLTLTNLGTNLYQAIDAASLFTSVRIKGSDVSTVLIGTNDHIYYATDADKRQVFKDALRSIIWWGAVPDKQKVRMQNVQLTAPPPTLLRAPTLLTNAGTSPLWGWSNLSGNYQGLPNYGDTGGGGNLGILSITSGAGVSMTLTGSSIGIEVAIKTTSTTGTYTITIDGVTMGTYSLKAGNSANFASAVGLVWAQRMHRFNNLSSGDHTLTITGANLGASTALPVTWAWGNGWIDPGAQPKVIVGTIPNTTSYTAPDSAANVTTFNNDVADVVAEAQADGYNVVLVDTRSAINTATDYRDVSHPNAGGQYKLSSVFMQEVVRP